MNQVAAHDDIAACASRVLAGDLDADVDVVNEVAFDDDARAAVDIDAVGCVLVAVGGIVE